MLNLLLSCEIFNCDDLELTLSRVELSDTLLRLDGFYYGNPESDWENTVSYETLVLYRNGILLRSGHVEFSKMDSYIESFCGTDVLQKTKNVWGIINIEGDSIILEHWKPAPCSLPVLLRSGKIVDEKTFVLSKMIRRDSQGTTESDINQTFQFRSLENKPDSTNVFVK